jgi:hypothetical protein
MKESLFLSKLNKETKVYKEKLEAATKISNLELIFLVYLEFLKSAALPK